MQNTPIAETASPADTSDDIRQRVRRLVKHCHAYKGSSTPRALLQLVTTASAFLIIAGLMIYSFAHGAYGIDALLLLPAAGLLVRLFIIQHDCGHGSFFSSRRANDILGRVISLFTFTPYDFWRKAHALHHASSGNLDRRGIGSVDTLTVKEYQELSPSKRLIYRFYRNPFVLLLLAPLVYIFLIQRFPPSQTLPFMKEYHAMPLSESWRSIVSLNLALVVCYGLLGSWVGWQALLVAYLPVVVLTAWIGGWLFFIQHQFEDAYWHAEKDWNAHEASLLGSTYYVMPAWLHWFTGNIGLHHIHHLCSMIPNYKLQPCLNDSRELQETNRMSFRESLKCIHLSLWDETRRKMIRFRDLPTKV